MQYARIFALIDAELDRLQKARQLLASLRLVPESAEKKILSSPPAAAPAVAGSGPSETADPQQISSVPQELVPEKSAAPSRRTNRTPRREKPVARKLAVVPLPKALGGVVSETPVFVPAGEIRQALAQRVQPIESGPSSATASDPLTTELLARKWLHSST
jgi:hypothetical protein